MRSFSEELLAILDMFMRKTQCLITLWTQYAKYRIVFNDNNDHRDDNTNIIKLIVNNPSSPLGDKWFRGECPSTL